MEVMKFVAENGEEILFDNWEYVEGDDEYPSFYWVTMCGKCLGKYGNLLDGREDDNGSGCCSVCGCYTPSWVDCAYEDDIGEVGQWAEDAVYVDFLPGDVVFCEI